MADSSEFAKQTLRAVAFLYDKHPKAETLTITQLLRPPIAESKLDVARLEFSIGTLRWLHRNGIVLGNADSIDKGYISTAQLPINVYTKLIAKDPQVSEPRLGDAVVRASNNVGSREEGLVADLLLTRFAA